MNIRGILGRANPSVMWLLLAALPVTGFAAAPNLDGTWKLARAQTLLTPADGGTIPFTTQGRGTYEANKAAAAKGDYSFDLTMERCASPGLPRLMLTPMRFRIFQRPTIIAVMFEWNRLLRQIAMPGSYAEPRRDPGQDVPSDPIGTAKGVTQGHWEGATLVAESSQFSGDTLLDNLLPTSDQLRLTEHIRLRGHDTLEDRITITDPKNFTRPWDTVLTYKRQPDDTFPEDVCLDRMKAGQSLLPH